MLIISPNNLNKIVNILSRLRDAIDIFCLQDGEASTATSVSRDASAVHLELMFVHHRIDCKLSLMKSGSFTVAFDFNNIPFLSKP